MPLALFGPPGGDEPAHLYRTELVREGVFVWDGFWFAGHYPLASYSLLYYFAAAVVGNVPLAVAAAIVATALFAAVSEREWGSDARLPAYAFAVVASGPIFTGTYPYAAGLSMLLACLFALQLGRVWLAGLAAVLTVGFSPLAFLFLVLALLAVAAVRRPFDRRTVLIVGGAVCVGGAAQALALAVFPHDATYPFFRPLELAAVFGVGTATAVLAYLIPTPVGENITRLRGLLLPLVLLVVVLARFRPAWLVGPAVAGALAYTLVPNIGAALHRGGGPATQRDFWEPAFVFLRANLSPGERIEVVPTADHWEAYWPPHEGFPIARGWYRQLDYAANRLFYETPLRADEYRAWLRRMGVRFVLLPDTRIGRAGEHREADLLLSGGSGLPEVARTGGWRIWEVPDAVTILPGGEIETYRHDEVSGRLPAPGRYRLALRLTPYWRVREGEVCLAEAADGMTELRAARAGAFALEIDVLARGTSICAR